jgi:hypothetical protein
MEEEIKNRRKEERNKETETEERKKLGENQ